MNYAPFADKKDKADLLQTLLTQRQQLPASLNKEQDQDLQALIVLIEHSRDPRFVLVGRRVAGKITLFNAICEAKVGKVGAVRAQAGATSGKTFEAPGGKRMHILDTRGMRAAKRPVEVNILSPLDIRTPQPAWG